MTIVLSIAYEKTPLKLALGTPSRVSVGAVVIGGPGPTGPTGPTGATGPTGPASSWDVIPDKPANITSIAGLTGAADKVLTSTGVGTFALVPMTAAGRAIIDDADAAAQRTTLGLGTAATLNTGTSSGNIPVLDAGGLLDTAVLPSVAITDVSVVASQAAMLALTAQKGDIAVRTDINKSFALSTNSPGTLADWKELLTPTDVVLSVAGLTGAISASALRSALTLVVGTDVQAYSAILAAVAGLTGAANDDVIQKKSGAFTNRTPAQLLADIVASALGTVTIPGTASTAAGVRLAEDTDNGTNYIGLRAPSSIAANKEFILPGVDGYAGDALVTDGAGNFSFSPRAIPDPTEFTTVRPTLDFDLTNINGAPFAGNHTRSTAGGYRMNSKGVLVPTAVNEPVIDFGADGVAHGTGFYGAYTNLLLRSEELDNASWTKSNVTVTSNSAVSSDGNMTMDTLDATVGGGLVTQAAGLTPSSTTIHTAEVRLRQGTAATTRVSLDFKTGGTLNSCQAVITWATKAVVLSGAANDKSYQLEDVGNGIYRLSLSGSNSGGANTAVSLAIYPADGGTGTVIAGMTSLTATSAPVPYVPTSSATVTRNADSMIVSGTDFSNFFNSVEGTIYAEVTTPLSGVGFSAIFQIDDGSNNNRHVCYYNSGNLSYFVAAGGVSVASPTRAVAGGTKIKVAVFFSANNFNIYVDGVGGTLDSSGALPTGLSRIKVGAGDGAWNARIRRLIYWPKALTAAELQRITA